MAGKQLSDGSPTGSSLGQNATDLIAFHGATPSDQRASLTVASAATLATVAAGVQEIIALLKEKGLMAT